MPVRGTAQGGAQGTCVRVGGTLPERISQGVNHTAKSWKFSRVRLPWGGTTLATDTMRGKQSYGKRLITWAAGEQISETIYSSWGVCPLFYKQWRIIPGLNQASGRIKCTLRDYYSPQCRLTSGKRRQNAQQGGSCDQSPRTPYWGHEPWQWDLDEADSDK